MDGKKEPRKKLVDTKRGHEKSLQTQRRVSKNVGRQKEEIPKKVSGRKEAS